MKCLKRLLKYRRRALGEAAEWDPDYAFSEAHSKPRDYLTADERRTVREAALEYGGVPSYGGLSPSVGKSVGVPEGELKALQFARAVVGRFQSGRASNVCACSPLPLLRAPSSTRLRSPGLAIREGGQSVTRRQLQQVIDVILGPAKPQDNTVTHVRRNCFRRRWATLPQ